MWMQWSKVQQTGKALPFWKILGVAGVVGVAATGIVVARAERRRRSYTPEEIKDRLRARHAEIKDS
jgi:hypothetical protein